MIEGASIRLENFRNRVASAGRNKLLVSVWLTETGFCLVGGILPAMKDIWWMINLGLAQAAFILLFWGLAWVLGTTGEPKKRKFFTEIPPGKFCLVVRGSEIVRALINVIGLTVRKTVDDPFEIVEGKDIRTFWDTLSSMIGIRCISVLPFSRLYRKKSEWNDEGRENPSDKTMEFIPRSEEIVFFSYQKNYGFVSGEVETGSGGSTTLTGGAPIPSERIPVDVKNLVQTRILYINRALILSDWIKVNGAIIDEAVIGFVGSHSIDVLIGQKPEELSGIADAIVARNDELLKRAGVENRSCQYKGYDYSGTGKTEMQEVSTARWRKTQEAEGNAELIEKPGMAEARVAVAKNTPLRERAAILKDAGPAIAGSIAYADNKTVKTYAPGSKAGILITDSERD